VSIFHRSDVGISLFFLFVLGIVVGCFKLFYHFLHFQWTHDKSSGRFVYRFMKAMDIATNAGVFDGRSDETISSHAGRVWLDKGQDSPVWVLIIRQMTEKWEENHIIESIEPSRPDDFDKETT